MILRSLLAVLVFLACHSASTSHAETGDMMPKELFDECKAGSRQCWGYFQAVADVVAKTETPCFDMTEEIPSFVQPAIIAYIEWYPTTENEGMPTFPSTLDRVFYTLSKKYPCHGNPK